MVECASLDATQDGNTSAANFTLSEDAETALNDAILVFRSIVKLSVEGDKKNDGEK